MKYKLKNLFVLGYLSIQFLFIAGKDFIYTDLSLQLNLSFIYLILYTLIFKENLILRFRVLYCRIILKKNKHIMDF